MSSIKFISLLASISFSASLILSKAVFSLAGPGEGRNSVQGQCPLGVGEHSPCPLDSALSKAVFSLAGPGKGRISVQGQCPLGVGEHSPCPLDSALSKAVFYLAGPGEGSVSVPCKGSVWDRALWGWGA